MRKQNDQKLGVDRRLTVHKHLGTRLDNGQMKGFTFPSGDPTSRNQSCQL